MHSPAILHLCQCINSLLYCFPAVDGAGLGGEVDAEFDDLLAGGEERLVIALLLYPPLCLGLGHRAGSRS